MAGVQHDYYSLIVRAVSGPHGSTLASRQLLYERARAAQLNNFDPALSEAEIKRECEALEDAIRAVEVETATADAARAESDRRITSDYAAFMAETRTRQDCFYDVSMLPHPKEAIVAAIEREIVRSTVEADAERLRSSTLFMWNFLEGIGFDPLPMKGGRTERDLSQLDNSGTQAPVHELKRLIASAKHKRDAERAKDFEVIAKKERQRN